MTKNLILECILVRWHPKSFSWVLSLVNVRYCYMLSSYAISWKTNQHGKLENGKNLVLGLILAHLARIPTANFFSQKFGFLSH